MRNDVFGIGKEDNRHGGNSVRYGGDRMSRDNLTMFMPRLVLVLRCWGIQPKTVGSPDGQTERKEEQKLLLEAKSPVAKLNSGIFLYYERYQTIPC